MSAVININFNCRYSTIINNSNENTSSLQENSFYFFIFVGHFLPKKDMALEAYQVNIFLIMINSTYLLAFP